MRVIKNQDDVRLMAQAKAIRPQFAEHLIQFFDELQADLEDMSPNTYRLEDTGHVVLLEAGDNVRDLRGNRAQSSRTRDLRLYPRVV